MGKNVEIQGSLKKSSINLSRYIRHNLGTTPEDIAKQDGVGVAAVNKSIRAIDAYRATHTVEFLNQSMIEVVMANTDHLKKAMKGGLTATKKDDKGKKVPDHTVQMHAIDAATKIVTALQPKQGKGIHVNVNQQQAVAGGTPPPESGFVGYEERLRSIRAKIDQHNQLPSATGDVIDDAADIEEDAEEVMAGAGNIDTQR